MSVSFAHYDETSNLNNRIVRSMIESGKLDITRELDIHVDLSFAKWKDAKEATTILEKLVEHTPNLEYFRCKSSHDNVGKLLLHLARCCPNIQVLQYRCKIFDEFISMKRSAGENIQFPNLRVLVYQNLPKPLFDRVLSIAPRMELVILHCHGEEETNSFWQYRNFKPWTEYCEKHSTLQLVGVYSPAGGQPCVVCSPDVPDTSESFRLQAWSGVVQKEAKRIITYEPRDSEDRHPITVIEYSIVEGDKVPKTYQEYCERLLRRVPEFGNIRHRISG